MIELLILFELSKNVLTMYGISKEIKKTFSVLTTPSYGTIKPALTRLENDGCVKVQRAMSKGGRPSTYYSITKTGIEELKRILLEVPAENPIQFLTTARIKLSCADLLNKDEQIQMFEILKAKAESILFDTKNIINSRDLSYYPRMVFDNITLEYQNFISLLEGFKNASNRK